MRQRHLTLTRYFQVA